MTDDPTEDTRELARLIRELDDRIRHLDIELAPFTRRENALRTQLKQTHGWVRDEHAPPRAFGMAHDGVQVAKLDLSPPAVEARMALWVELDRVAMLAGPGREQRRIARIEMKSAQAALERIMKARERPGRD